MAKTTRPEPADGQPDETPADDTQASSAGLEPTEPEPTEPQAEAEPTEPEAEAAAAEPEPGPTGLEPPGTYLPFTTDLAVPDDPRPAGSTVLPALGAEVFGTFVLVLAGVGTALYSGVGAGSLNGGPLAVALAFGLALAAGVAAFGHVSGAHFNPAVTLGAALAGRFGWARVLPYVLAQVFGGFLAALVLFVTVPSKLPTVTSGDPTADVRQFFSGTANGFDHAVNYLTLSGANSPLGRASNGQITVSLLTALTIEAVVTAAFVGVILAVTRRRANWTAAPLAIGGALTVGLLVTMPLTNGSLNPARSTAVVLFSDAWAAGQLWVFWVGPLLGAVIAGLAARVVAPPEPSTADEASNELARPAG